MWCTQYLKKVTPRSRSRTPTTLTTMTVMKVFLSMPAMSSSLSSLPPLYPLLPPPEGWAKERISRVHAEGDDTPSFVAETWIVRVLGDTCCG
jgi:hypothetical protein